MKKYLTFFAAALLAAGCQNDETTVEEQQQKGDPITIGVDEGSLTRAPGEINQANIGILAEKGFGVFACYTGKLKYENTTVSPDYMYNQKVIGETTTDGLKWVYNPIKYWPNTTDQDNGNFNEYVTFFAYAPYVAEPQDDGKGGIIDMSKKYDLGDPWINFRLPVNPWSEGEGGQIDLMYGVRGYHMNDNGTFYDDLFIDQQKGIYDTTGKLNFQFRHALACIGDEITIQLTPEMANYLQGYATITVSKLTITYKNLTTKGRLVLNSPSGPNWKEIISGELTTERTFTKTFDPLLAVTTEANENNGAMIKGQGLFYIPMQVRGTDAPYGEAVINYTVTVTGSGATYSGYAKTTFPLSTSLEGQKQGIALQITKDLNLLHLTYDITDDPATEPSYSRITK